MKKDKRRYDSYNTKNLIMAIENEERHKRMAEEKAKREAMKQSPEYIRNEKMRKLLQHNAEFLKLHKPNVPTIQEYEEELTYLSDQLLLLIENDLNNKPDNFKEMKEIMTFYNTNFKIVADYNALILKSNPRFDVVDNFFLNLIKLNSYFLCVAPLRCFLTEGLPMDKLDSQTIKKFLLPRIEKSPIRMVKSFVENYGKYFDLNVGI